jgi:hemerythrin-like domain-containing protein
MEMFLGSLEAASEAIAQPPAEETRQTLTAALRYFAQAAPKHTADEEESLFPRLRNINDTEVESVFASLEELEDDHRWAAPLHAAVERLGEQYLLTGSLTDAEVTEFRNSVARLSSMYRRHIGIEDELVFPLAERLLSKSEKAAIAQEMADRRNVPLVVDIAGYSR